MRIKIFFISSKFRGFTLIEMIVYLAILGILIVGIVSISLIVRTEQIKFMGQRRVATDLNTFFNNVDFLVRNSSGFVTDNTGKQCQDFEGTQGYNAYYLSLFYNSSTAMSILPYECSGSFTATTTAVKIYWRDSSHRGLWIDCYRGFANGETGNCTKIQSYGDASFYMTSDKNTAVYNGGLVFATSTAYGNPVLSTTVTMGLPNSSILNYFSATTTASSTTAFRTKISNIPTPTEQVCGDGVRQTGEVCDSTFSGLHCAGNSDYYTSGYVEDGSTCSGKAACNKTCTACISSSNCTGVTCSGILSGGKCWYLATAGQSCTTFCGSHGGCLAGNNFDDASCTLLQAWGANCAGGCNLMVGAGFYCPVYDNGSNCWYGTSLSERCATNPPAGSSRLCACNT